MVQTCRSQQSPAVTSATSWREAEISAALSATGPCSAAKSRPSLSSGAQCEGTQTHSQGRVPVGAVEHGEVFLEREFERIRGAKRRVQPGA